MIITTTSSKPTFAQNPEDRQPLFQRSFGVIFANLTGYGLYFNQRLTENWYFKLNGVIYYYEWRQSSEKITKFNYDYGFEFQRDFRHTRISRAFILAGAYHTVDDYYEKKSSELKRKFRDYSAGIGLGLEFYYRRYCYGFTAGYKYFDKLGRVNGTRELFKRLQMGVGVSAGIIF